MPTNNGSLRKYDLNGYFEIKGNPLSRAGVFDYLGSSIGAPEPNRMYKVYRPAEELQDPECIESFRLVPLIDDHTMLGAKNQGLTPPEEKIVHGVIGEDVNFSEGYLRGNLRIFSEKLKNLIASGKKELSCGYRCVYEMAEGVYDGVKYDAIQRQIRGNHIALVEQGRMGPTVAVLDHFTFTIDAKEILDMSLEKLVEDQKAALDKLTTAVDGLVEKVEKLEKAKDKEEPPEKEEDKPILDKAAADALETRVKAAEDNLESFKKEALKSVMSEVSRRDQLVTKLKPHIGSFDAADKTLAEVAKYGIEKLGLTCADGQEEAALNGFLHNRKAPEGGIIAKDAGEAKPSFISSYLTKKEQ